MTDQKRTPAELLSLFREVMQDNENNPVFIRLATIAENELGEPDYSEQELTKALRTLHCLHELDLLLIDPQEFVDGARISKRRAEAAKPMAFNQVTNLPVGQRPICFFWTRIATVKSSGSFLYHGTDGFNYGVSGEQLRLLLDLRMISGWSSCNPVSLNDILEREGY